MLLKPLGQMFGVSTVATRLAPREPFGKRTTLPATAGRLIGLLGRRPSGRCAHVQQANGAARQRFSAVGAGRHLRIELENMLSIYRIE